MAFLCVITLNVKAETLTYEVCESGCEYANLNDVITAIRNIGDLSDKDIVINVNSDITTRYNLYIGSIDNMANSVTINGNNKTLEDVELNIYAKNTIISNFNALRQINVYDSTNLTVENIQKSKALMSIKTKKTNILNSGIDHVQLWTIVDNSLSLENAEKSMLSDILVIDNYSLNFVNLLVIAGNIEIHDMDFKNTALMLMANNALIYNSKLSKLTMLSENGHIDIYNSQFNSLRYVNIKSQEESSFEEWNNFIEYGDKSVLTFDIYDVNIDVYDAHTHTTIHFDKEAKLKPRDKLNLVDYLDYYTEDKEIEYTIEDESIAKIENKELIGLKEGSTNVTVTTDDGHVVYYINLAVEKETIPEKIDKMTIKVPITGSKIKAWVVAVSVILVGVALVCSYIFVKNIKARQTK